MEAQVAEQADLDRATGEGMPERYQSAREFIRELRARQAAVEVAKRKGKSRVVAIRKDQERNGGF